MKKLKNIMVFASILMLLFVSTNVVQAKDKVIKVQAAWPAMVPFLGKTPFAQAEKFNVMAKGTGIQFDLKNRKDLGKPWDVFKQIKEGKVDAAYSTPGYFTKIMPGTAIFTSIPYGPDMVEYISWLKHGGGAELYQEELDRNNLNVKVIHPCLVIAPEGGGWFNKEIKKPSDFKGIKMRVFGLAKGVVEAMGAETVLLPGGKIVSALKEGKINATEFSMPYMDVKYGLHKHFKYMYLPSWFQQASVASLFINKDLWNSLNDQQQGLIEGFCTNVLIENISMVNAMQGPALETFRKEGVIIKTYSRRMLKAFKKEWIKVNAQMIKDNPHYAKWHKHYSDFRKDYKEWKSKGFLK